MVKLVTPLLLLAALAIVSTPATAFATGPECHRVVVSLQQVAQPLGAQVCRPEV